MKENKISVIQVIDQLNAGGAERVLVNWANILHEKGQQSAVITTVGPGVLAKALQEDIELFDLRRKWKWNPFAMYRLVKILKNYDVIHVHSSHNLRYVWLASKLFRLKKIIFFHEHFYFEKISWHRRAIYPKTKMICVSNFVRDWAIKNNLSTEKNVFILPNIIVPHLIDIAPGKKQKDIVKIVMTGNIAPRKNIEFALEIFNELKKQLFENYNLTIIGSVTDKKYYTYLQNKITIYGLEKQVQFIHDCDNIQPILNQFDLALHPSKFETGPLVLIEYLAKSLPFLSSNTGEVPAQIGEELPGFIIKNNEPETWAAAIQEIITMDKKILDKKMKTVFEKYYSIDQYYEKGMSIYAKGLEKET